MDNSKDPKGVPINHFWGETNQPDSIEKLFERRSILGDGKVPKELEYQRKNKSFFIESKEKPKVVISEIEKSNYQNTWKIDIPNSEITNYGSFALNGKKAIKSKPEEIIKEIDANVSVKSFRPDWIDGSFAPKLLHNNQISKLRRINGKFVDPLYVFGRDDRWSFRDPAWPWGLVGKVFTSGGWTGTGVLVGERTLLTAGHVVPWNQENWWMRFVPAFYDGSSLHGVGVESNVSDARGFDVNGNVTGYDWAVCRLYEPLGRSLGYFGFNGYSDSWNNNPIWSIIGYPGAVAGGQRPSFQGNNSVFDTDGDSAGGLEIETRADLTPGNSGGPMFAWWGGDPRVVGVVSGQEEEWSPGFWPWEWGNTERVNVIAGGSGFTNLIAWARSNWP
jgi:V8-like Glu-specific endopeptidase